MRAKLFTLLLAAPVAVSISAHAQTPHDLAQLTWGSTTPTAVTSSAPRNAQVLAGGASAVDLARLAWPDGAPVVRWVAPHGNANLLSGATPGDLARLSGPRPVATPAVEESGTAMVAHIVQPRG